MQEIVELFLCGFWELVAEIVIKGPGYLIVRIIRPQDRTDPDGCLVMISGLAFWCLAGMIWWAFS